MTIYIRDDEVEEMGQEGEEAPLVEPLPGSRIETIPLSQIELPKDTKVFLTDAKRLAKSITLVGMLEIPAVAPLDDDLLGDTRYKAMYGRRRLRAAKLLNWSEVRVIVYAEELTVEQELLVAEHENASRSDDWGETIWRLFKLLHEVGNSEDVLAEKLQINKGTLNKFLKFVRLPRVLVEHIHDGKMTQSIATKVARLPKREQEGLACDIIHFEAQRQIEIDEYIGKEDYEEPEEVRVTEEMIQQYRNVVHTELTRELSKPLFPEGLLEELEQEQQEDSEAVGEQSLPQEDIPSPQQMIGYLKAYEQQLPAWCAEPINTLIEALVGL